MKSITFFPVVEKESQLIDLLSRASWYLTFCPLDRIYIPIRFDHLRNIPWQVADGMDEAIEQNFEKLRSRVNFILAKKESDLRECISKSEIILRWQINADLSGSTFGSKLKRTFLRWNKKYFSGYFTLESWLKGKKVWEVDPVTIRMEGSFYIQVGLHLIPNKADLVKENQSKFESLSKKRGKFKRAYLMATGPSISNYKKYDFENSLIIVCNSVILDEDLMQTVKPQILVFADPIFHFGPSQYAGAFRKSLIDLARRYDFAICIPFNYYGLFISAIPELADQTIGIPNMKNREWNFSLDKFFNLKTTANILTFLMIPIASTFAREIGFLGCDGRPLEDNKYIWGHNEKIQINEKMVNIREVHPAFFSINYNTYYLEHCNTLDDQLKSAQKQGLKFYSLAFSHIPALKSRISRVWLSSPTPPDPEPETVIIVDPDGKDFSGHFVAYNTNFSNALSVRGIKATVLCNKSICDEILTAHANHIPRLTVHSWTLGLSNNKQHQNRLQLELFDVLDEILTTDARFLLYSYVGSLEHALVYSETIHKYPSLYVNLNLFWLSFRDLYADKDYVEQWRPFMEWLEFAGPRLVATVPTRELQQEVAQVFGVILDVAPHPSTAVPDSILSDVLDRKARQSNDPKKVFFPGSLREEKGYLSALECARILGNESGIQTIFRYLETSTTPSNLLNTTKDLPTNAFVVDGVLSNNAFRKLFSEADIVVLPYSSKAFRNRTSGLLIDALAYLLPAVVVEGTWLANHVQRYECGVVVPDNSPQSLAAGVRNLLANINSFKMKTRSAASSYFEYNSWEALVDFIFKPFSLHSSFPESSPSRENALVLIP